VSTDKESYTVGDATTPFSIQSISKVYSLVLAMEEAGAHQVFAKIGSEATGRPFNSVSAVVDMPTHTGNPLVNAGAIATVSLIKGSAADKWNKILNFYSRAAGERLSLIQDIYQSEAATNQGNRALGYLLLKYENLRRPPGIRRCLYEAVLGWRECKAACGHGRNTRQSWRQSDYRRTTDQSGARAAHPFCYGNRRPI